MVLRSGKVRKAEVMCHSSAGRRRGLHRLGWVGAGPLPITEDASQVWGLLGVWSGNFSFFAFSMQRGTGKGERVSTSDFCRLIACWSWLLSRAGWFTCNSSWKTHLLRFWRRSSLQKRTLNLGLIGIEINKRLTNNESRKRFFKSRVHVKKWTQFRLLKDLSFWLYLSVHLLESKEWKIL